MSEADERVDRGRPGVGTLSICIVDGTSQRWRLATTSNERENDMLTLTDNAADIVKQIADQVPDTGSSGLRISTTDDGPDGGLTLTAAQAPEPGDRVVDEEGARVFLDEAAATLLDDKILDAEVKPDGAVTFGLGQQV
jgi:iron-sulfur cluster assembly protein